MTLLFVFFFYLAQKFLVQQIPPQLLNPSGQWCSQNGMPSPRWMLSGDQSLRWIQQNKPNHSSSPLGGQRQKGLSRRRSESASRNQSRRVASLPHIHHHHHPHLENEQYQKKRERERGQWKWPFYSWPHRAGIYNHHIYGAHFHDSKAKESLIGDLGETVPIGIHNHTLDGWTILCRIREFYMIIYGFIIFIQGNCQCWSKKCWWLSWKNKKAPVIF